MVPVWLLVTAFLSVTLLGVVEGRTRRGKTSRSVT